MKSGQPRRSSWPACAASLALLVSLWPAAATAQRGSRTEVPGIPGVPPNDAGRRPNLPRGVPTTEETVFWPTENEVKLGWRVAAEVEKEYEILREGPLVEQLARVAREVVAAVADPELAAEYRRQYRLPKPGDRSLRVPFQWSFQVVRRKDRKPEINAFSLAGGPIYVTTDLMEYATSDHELAAVLAHEISHVAFHHIVHLAHKQSRAQRNSLWSLLAAIIVGAAGGADAAETGGNLAVGTQLYSLARVTHYGRDLEREADRVGIQLLLKTGYHPVGMLTFMKKLARDDLRHGNPDYGIFQTHPFASERVGLIERELRQRGIPFDRGVERQVSHTFRIETAAVVWQGRPAGEVRINGNVFFRALATEGNQSPAERARRIGEQLERLLEERGLSLRQVRLAEDGITLLALGQPLLTVLPADAAAERASQKEVAERALKILHAALWREKLDGIY